jgi:hypothetical protein
MMAGLGESKDDGFADATGTAGDVGYAFVGHGFASF